MINYMPFFLNNFRCYFIFNFIIFIAGICFAINRVRLFILPLKALAAGAFGDKNIAMKRLPGISIPSIHRQLVGGDGFKNK
jgi:hypothetical protein